MDVPAQHQIKIAKQTLRLSDVSAFILGGMSKAQAREILRDKAGRSQAKIEKYENA